MIDIYVYSESQQGILDMVHEYVPEDDTRYGHISFDWMPPGTVSLNMDKETPEYDEDNWYCNLRFSGPVEYIANNLYALAEQAFNDGQIKSYRSQRQPGVTHNFPYLNRNYDENVYFTRTVEGYYLPQLPRRVYVGGPEQGTVGAQNSSHIVR